MVWNLQFQFAALLIVLVIAAMCLGQRRLNFAAQRAYNKLLFTVIISILADILSIFAINYRAVIGDPFCMALCKFYLLTIVVVAYQSAIFAVAEIRHTFHPAWVKLTAAPVLAEFLVLLFLPIQIYTDDSSIYTYGTPVLTTYILCAVYIISTCVMVVFLRRHINAKRKYAIYFWMCCWAMVASLQFINNELLIVSFAMALACMYMYCKLENPDYQLDFATNAFNRKGFTMIMSEYLENGSDRSLVTFTIGNMNMLNEVFGRHVVEKLFVDIVNYAEKLTGSTVFRLEDSMFCICVAGTDAAERAVEQLEKRFEQPWQVDGIYIELGAHISYIADIQIFNTVENLEEIVFFFAQESHKKPDGEVLYVNEDELNARKHSLDIQTALEWALKNDGVEVYYQPIYNIKEGRFSAAEALVRIRDANGSVIMPGEFIEFAEKNGTILKLGEIVFRKVCEFFQRMHVEEYGIEYIEVNLSVVQCMQENLGGLLKDILGEYQIPPYRVNFEITETAAVNSKKAIDKNMKELIEYGCGFSLDDYGSGYSNLSYVVNLPLNIIKLDKQLVDEYFVSQKVKIATEYTIEMLHKLGMEIVVEGIETEEQYLAFKNLGVEFIQGYYFSKPLPKNQVLNYIQEWL